jgi:pimeloyl-ACP methyl ester carboxylesterase
MIDQGSGAANGRLVNVGGCEIHVVERNGPGRTIVLVHGLGASTVLWDAVVPRLPEELRILAIDLRGCGGSRETEPAELTTMQWAYDLRVLLERLGVADAAIVGHSLGATVALEYTLRWPKAVVGLVLINGEARLGALAPRMQRSADLIRANGLESWARDHWVLNPPFAPTSLESSPELLDTYRTMLLANRPEDYVRACEAIVNAEDLTSRLGEVTQPTAVVVGALDDRTVPEAGRLMAEALPDAGLTEVADGGHTLPMEAPDEVAEAISALLARLED